MGLFYDMLVSTSLIPFLHCPIMLYSLQAVCIQNVAGWNVTILGDHIIGHSKQKTVYVHVPYSERFLRKSYLTAREFGFDAQNWPSLKPYWALLDFSLWGWMKSEVYGTKLDTREKLLFLVMYVITSIKEIQDALRLATRHVLTRVANCMSVDGGNFENVLYWVKCTNYVTWTTNTDIRSNT